jgi:hypothetical protein
MARTQDKKFNNLRPLLAASYRSLPDERVEQVVSAQGLQARAIEDFWDDVGDFVSAALPIVGGVAGSFVAPGVGTAIGAGLGSAAGGALHSAIHPSQQQPPPAPTPSPAAAPAPAASPVPAAAPAPAVSPVPSPAPAAHPTMSPPQQGGPYPYQFPYAAPAAPATSQQFAAQLLQLIMHPQLLQALLQMLLGSVGSPAVPIPATPAGSAGGSTAVPLTAFTNALSTIASQTSEAYNAERGVSPSAGSFHYGAGPWGSPVDIASPEHRARGLMELLRESGGGTSATRARQQRKQRLVELAQALREVDRRAG